MSIAPRGMSVQEAYREFRDGNFQVNRSYQRKLVWSLDEKQKLVDSILVGYPIPLILLAYELDENGKKRFEILDGMQRLNAIFSFIENGFSVAGSFFDVEQLARAKQLLEEGKIPARPEGTPLLHADACARFLEYTLAVTEFPATNPRSVSEVFGRINSYGRQLSDQERRQAGVLSSFATTVREISAEIRGDVSSESLDLAQMPEISIDVGGGMSEYVIKADDTFWCSHGILRRNQLRESEDEQMIADLTLSILGDAPFAFSGASLDEAYRPLSELSEDMNLRLTRYGATKLKSDIVGTIAVMRGVFRSADIPFRKIVNPNSANPAKTAFYAVFMAFFDLCARQKKSPSDHTRIVAGLSGVQSSLEVAAGQVRSEPREKNIQKVKGLIQDYFVDLEPAALNHGTGAEIRFENALRRSRVETAAYECKQGILRLDSTRVQDPGILDKLVLTICGIANIGPASSGAIFVGVADKPADKTRIESLDGIQAAHIGARFCVGIDREANLLGMSVEAYCRTIASHISHSKLSEPLRTAVCASIDTIVYRGLSIVCIWIPSMNAPSDVDDKMYVRSGSETEVVNGLKRTRAVMSLFASA